MIITKFLSVLCASVVLAGPIERSFEQQEVRVPNGARDAGSKAAAVSSAAPPTLQTGTPPVEANQKVLQNSGASVKPNSAALTPGWVEPGSNTFIDICLYHHNVHRANHSAPAMVWNSTLYQRAQWKAEKCQWSESSPPSWGTVGMNIAGGSYGIPKRKPNPSGMISGLWYNSEMMNYPGYGNPNPPMKNFENWGHFSQVVWPGSRQLGCGLADCGDHWFGLCLYWPAGNWLGEFNRIQPPQGNPIVFPNGQTKM